MSYEVKIDRETCINCGVCLEDVCPSGLIQGNGSEPPDIVPECTSPGCILCISVCGVGAIERFEV